VPSAPAPPGDAQAHPAPPPSEAGLLGKRRRLRSLRALVGSYPVRAWLGPGDAPVAGLADHSACAGPGDVFVCVRGRRDDGHRFAAEAVRRGAAAIVAEEALPLSPAVVQLIVADARHCLARLAAEWHGHPSARLTLVAVTGTNGKTTTTFLVDAIARQAGHRTGLVGTVKVAVAGRERPARRTTPGALELQSHLAEMAREGVGWATIEASSHSLAQFRIDGCQLDAAVFTNLSQDHFDFHGDFEGYFRAKRRLFELLDASPKPRRAAVVNVDDPYGGRLAAARRGAALVDYALVSPARVQARDVVMEAGGSRFRLAVDGRHAEVRLPLPGRFNVYNALAAAGAAWSQGIELDAIASGLEQAPPVPGRWQVVESDGVTVVVDFAHNPGGLRSVLPLARQVARGRLIVVFGAPGAGDRQKRPAMGELAARYADHCIITQDDSPDEDPEAVAREVELGVRRAGAGRDRYEVILDRPRAIARAVEMALPGDLVLVCGRGHETHLAVGGRRIPMRDDDLVRESLAARAAHTSAWSAGVRRPGG
jgi:UDP-N-acetylmuramoyl-L-alanyl-D-glutamate--2,6-diaminopimelate ligase